MNRWRQMLDEREPVVFARPGPTLAPIPEMPAREEIPVLPPGTLILCAARRAGYPRLRLQVGVYVCGGVEMWRRFVRTAEPEWLEKAERALAMLILADKPEGSHDGH